MGIADFGILGPLTVAIDDRAVRVSAAKQRAVLGVLLIHANQHVTADRLLHELWLESLPKTGRGTLQSLVSRLRRLIIAPDVLLESGARGYRLNVAPERVDAHRFEELGRRGSAYAAEGSAERSARTLSEALALWRGPVLADVPQVPLIATESARLDELRVTLTERRIDMDLRLGRHADLIMELRALVAEHPFRERFWEQLMQALHQSGRVGEALSAYRSAREIIVGEFGLEPGVPLRMLHLDILRGSVTPPTAPIQVAPPRQLPAAISDFAGRDTELAAIGRHLRPGGPSLPLVVVSGMPGAGKTALAVRAAHEAAERFPDGQLFADLGGTSRRPATPAETLGRFLHALGVPHAEIPPDPLSRADLFRSRISGRRILVVLDDAVSEAQVEPLLPGSASCSVVITGRRRLTVLGGALRVEVGTMRRAESVRLITMAVGDARRTAEPSAVAALADACGDLPLALRICASRLAANPHLTLSSLVERLAVDRARLDEFQHGRLRVGASFMPSYEALEPSARRLFRRLGALDMPSFPAWTAAAILDSGPRHGRRALDALVESNLLEPTGSEDGGEPCFRLHKLARAYSRRQARRDDGPAAVRQAIGRVLGGWLQITEQACQTAFGSNYMLSHGDAARWSPGEGYLQRLVSDPWPLLEAERPNLVAAVKKAALDGMDELCWDLAATSTTLFGTGAYFEDWQETHDVALAAVRVAGNRRGEAVVMRHIGGLRIFQGRYAEAHTWLNDARSAFREIGDLQGEAFAIIGRGIALRKTGRHETALRHFESARGMLGAAGDPLGVAHALRNLGQIRFAMADLRQARENLTDALRIARAQASLPVEGHVQQCLGEVLLSAGQYREAIESFTQAAAIAERVHDRQGQERALHWAARAHLLRADAATATSYLSRASEIARSLGDHKMIARITDTLEFARARDLPLGVEV
ncbi:MAG: BTAD domain-containing putative transcriptional regulator [Actinoallomurus sp.]